MLRCGYHPVGVWVGGNKVMSFHSHPSHARCMYRCTHLGSCTAAGRQALLGAGSWRVCNQISVEGRLVVADRRLHCAHVLVLATAGAAPVPPGPCGRGLQLVHASLSSTMPTHV